MPPSMSVKMEIEEEDDGRAINIDNPITIVEDLPSLLELS